MQLATGERLGPYEILALLGKGGMGEVYRARDAKLNRDVAIKVLPPALANDADYRARFEREAQVLSREPAEGAAGLCEAQGMEAGRRVADTISGRYGFPRSGVLTTDAILAIPPATSRRRNDVYYVAPTGITPCRETTAFASLRLLYFLPARSLPHQQPPKLPRPRAR